MILKYNTKLNGTIALTDEYYSQKELQREPGLYKSLWVRSGNVSVVVDHQKMSLSSNEVISLSHIQHLDLIKADGDYLMLVFNSNFFPFSSQLHCCEKSLSIFNFSNGTNVAAFPLMETEVGFLSVRMLSTKFLLSD